MLPSDHTPCLITISTRIPRAKIFRFENYWLLDEQFPQILNSAWQTPLNSNLDKAKVMIAKFKILRKKLKEWQASKTGLHTTIANSRLVLQMLEHFEEFRDLSIHEWNFKELRRHLVTLLEQQRVYWKQRGTIKWATLGDARTKFFHNNATIKFRKSLITELESSDGSIALDHRQKEAILWKDFKERLGTSEFQGFQVDPTLFIQPRSRLHSLENPFQHEEIDNIIKALPNDKSPGPDGFNNEFLKKCWPVIKFDFYDLCRDFYNHNVCLSSINSSFITLIPKVEVARRVNEFRPISLLNSSVKLITKLLANRL
jgi:hypothetical protein